MRISHQMIAESTLNNIERNLERVQQLQSQITSGSQITKPSDNPVGAARALSFQEGVTQTGQYLNNIDQAAAWLNTTDSTLGSVTDLLHRARELSVQAANGTMTPSDLTNIRAEVTQLQQDALDLSHAKFGNYYLFAGTRSDQPGYVQAASTQVAGPSVYQGNSGAVLREISPGVSMSVNADATATFDPVFEALGELQTGLSAASPDTLQKSLGDMDTALSAVLTTRSQIGAKANRLDFLKTRLTDVQVNLTGLLSDVKDVDMAQAITNFSMAQTTYQASLKASAQALQPSLLDYLR
jgi:flagellar hook-associated protein 3 FlgL